MLKPHEARFSYALCSRMGVKVKSVPSKPMLTVSPSRMVPAMMLRLKDVSTVWVIKRRRGRAPN